MNKKLREACIKAGMDAQLSDEDAMRWFQDHQGDALRALNEELDPETPPPAAPTVTRWIRGRNLSLNVAPPGFPPSYPDVLRADYTFGESTVDTTLSLESYKDPVTQ